MRVYLENRGNPDFGQDPNHPIYGTDSDFFVRVDDLEEAKQVVQNYITSFELGSGAWTGGHVFNGTTYVGAISYNCHKVWGKDDEYGRTQFQYWEGVKKNKSVPLRQMKKHPKYNMWEFK